MASRKDQLRSAIRASLVSVGFGAVVGLGALSAGLLARSLALLGFALDAVVDLLASILLLQRFHAELANRGHGARLEQGALRVISWLLVVAGLFVAVQAVRALISAVEPERTGPGIIIAGASVLVLPGLAYWKRRLSHALGSRALRADSFLTGVGAILAAIALVGVLLNQLLRIGRADAAAALLIALVLGVEGVRGVWE
jgi:divalent metal cation (Fe/Co/Zn/Cd) transporter